MKEANGEIELIMRQTEMIRRLVEQVGSVKRELAALRGVVTHGATGIRPWSRLPRPRQRQIEAVVEYLRQHPSVTITRAAGATWEGPVKDGYPSVASLACYCYARKVYVYAV